MRVFAWFQSLLSSFFAALIGGGWNSLSQLIAAYERLSDAELLAEYEREALRLDGEPEVRILRALQRYRHTPEAAIMAISVVAFNRCPADLPAGSAAYPEQIQAAQCLVDQVNVQMETGEGKTYAIALALPTLVARHGQAWVMTVNNYLAERDAERVRSYLDFLGIEVRTGLPPAGFRGVAYQQFSSAAFGYLYATYGNPTTPLDDYPRWAGVVLDEIDSILIDSDEDFALSELVEVGEAAWPEVFGAVASWSEDTQFTFDRVHDNISLTPSGWRHVQQLARDLGQPAQRIHQMAEAATWAEFAKEGRDYVRDGEVLLRVNQVTGALLRQDSSIQMNAVRFKLTGKPAWVDRTFAMVSRLDLLGKHPHVVGLSGTAAADLLYYQIVLGTWTIAITPRFVRSREKPPTRFFGSRSSSLDAITAEIGDRPNTPTVVIAWSVNEAHATAHHILEKRPDATVNIVTVFDSETSNAVIAQAGIPGAITVLSSGGCRGIDIRSTHSPHLVILGHGQEPRLDRQVLGRVGRHGEPFSAEFIEDPDTPLVRSTPVVQRNLQLMGRFTDGELDLPRQLGWQFRRLQSQWWRSTTARRSVSGTLAVSARQAEELFSACFASLRTAVREGDVERYVRTLDTLPAQREAVLAAIERRKQNDSGSIALAETVRSMSATYGLRAHLQFEVDEAASDAGLIADIDKWAKSLSESKTTGPDAAMIRCQLQSMTNLQFRVPSSPETQTVTSASYAVLKTAGAAYLEEVARERDRLWVNYSGATFYRKCAVLFLTHATRITDSVAQRTLEALHWIDRPLKISHLFPKLAYYNSGTGEREKTREATTATKQRNSSATIDDELLNKIIITISHDLGPGVFGGGPSEREITLNLHALAATLTRRLPYMTSAQVEHELRLELQRQIATGYRGRDCKVFYRAAARLVNELEANGVGAVRVREGAPTLLTRVQTRMRLARTISPLYLLSLAIFFSLAIAGVFFPTQQAPEWLESIGNVLGFGWIGAGSFASITLGSLVFAGLLADATGVIDEEVFLVQWAPVVAAVATGWVTFTTLGPGYALLLGLVTLIWTRTILVLRRFTVQGSAMDPLHLLAALSVIGFLVFRHYPGVDDQALYFLPWVVIGIILCSGAFSIPVGRSERSADGDPTPYRQVLSSMRLALDPTLGAGFVAFVVTVLLLPWLHEAGGVIFASVQIGIYAGVLLFRTRNGNVQKILARREYAQVGSEDEVRLQLNRSMWLTLLWLTPVGAGSVVLAAVTQQSPGTILLAEVGGFILLIGWREMSGIAGGGQADRSSNDDQLRREQRAYVWKQFKVLIKRPAGKIGALVIVITVIWNLLNFFLNLYSLPELLRGIWKWLTGTA